MKLHGSETPKSDKKNTENMNKMYHRDYITCSYLWIERWVGPEPGIPRTLSVPNGKEAKA
jgi:hypothetical protein